MQTGIDYRDVERYALDQMAREGISPPKENLHLDGTVQRYRLEDEKAGGKSGAYQIWADGKSHDGWPHGWFMDHRRGGERVEWQYPRANVDPSVIEANRAKAHFPRGQAKRDAEEKAANEKQRLAIENARRAYAEAGEVDPTHPYLVRKGVGVYGDMRQSGDKLLLPWRDIITGELVTIQTITADGGKRWYKGAPKRGGYIIAGDVSTGPVIITEGAATALSVYEALPESTVITAGDAGSLKQAAAAARKRWPQRKIFICADDDWKREQDGKENTGIKAARAVKDAGLADGILVPTFPRSLDNPDDGSSDWNDYFRECGVETTARELAKQVREAVMAASAPGMTIREAEESATPKEAAGHQLIKSRIEIVDGMDLPRSEQIAGLFPRGGVSFIPARAGEFKTWLSQRLAIDMSKSGGILGEYRNFEPRRKVLYICGETHWPVLVRRARSMQWDMSQETFFLYDAREMEKQGHSLMLDTKEGRTTLDALLNLIDPDAVFLDSFGDFFLADENKASEMKPIMVWLDEIAARRNMAVILPYHNNKRKVSERRHDVDQDDMIGSSVLQRYANLQLSLRRRVLGDGQEWIYVKCTRSRNRYPIPFAFRIEDLDTHEDERHRTIMKIQVNPETGATKGDRVEELIKASFNVGEWFAKKEVIDLARGAVSARSIEGSLSKMQENGELIDNGEKTNKLRYQRTR